MKTLEMLENLDIGDSYISDKVNSRNCRKILINRTEKYIEITYSDGSAVQRLDLEREWVRKSKEFTFEEILDEVENSPRTVIELANENILFTGNLSKLLKELSLTFQPNEIARILSKSKFFIKDSKVVNIPSKRITNKTEEYFQGLKNVGSGRAIE